jgi:hypothetical protein
MKNMESCNHTFIVVLDGNTCTVFGLDLFDNGWYKVNVMNRVKTYFFVFAASLYYCYL